MQQKLLNTLKELYSLPFDHIRLHRDMIGYVCIVLARNDKYVLKLFKSKHAEQAIQSVEIMEYLYKSGYPTAKIIPTENGIQYFNFDMQGESRIGVLYEYINGTEPDKSRVIEHIGRQTGELHNLMKCYNANLSCHNKPFFIDRYINLLSQMEYPRVDQFREYGNILWNRVERLPRGFCHGDYHTGNMLLKTNGRNVIFDFDAAANAFSVYDIAVICDMTDYFSLSDEKYNETSRILERFLQSYQAYSTLSEEEILHVYDFIAIRHFEVQATIIENLGLSCVDENFLDQQFAWLMKWEKLIK